MARTMNTRLEARVQPEIYEILKYAAEVTGRTLTDFVISSAYAEAKKAISEHTNLTLSIQDQQKVVEALSNPAEPTPAMQQAMEKHRQLFGKPIC